MAQNKLQWRPLVSKYTKLSVPWKEKNLLSNQASARISRRTVLRGVSYLRVNQVSDWFTYLTIEQAQESGCRKTNLLIQHLLQTTLCSSIERNDLTHSRFPWLRRAPTRNKALIVSPHSGLYHHVRCFFFFFFHKEL